MEVTKSNFAVVLPKFVEYLTTADFVAIDCEMTGVDRTQPTVNDNDSCPFMRLPSAQFGRKNDAAKRYSLIQLGVTLFHQKHPQADPPSGSTNQSQPRETGSPPTFVEDDDETGLATGMSGLTCGPTAVGPNQGQPQGSNRPTFEARGFNFYLFPSDELGDIALNVETAKFLSSHGMDFSKWIAEGIPYVTVECASRLRAEAVNTADFSWASRAPTPEDVGHFTAIQAKAARLARSKSKVDQFELPFLKDQNSPFIVTELLALYGLTFVNIKTETGKRRRLVVCGPNPGKTSALAAAESKLGATLLFEALIRAQRPLVTHNGFVDLLMLYYAFHERQLQDYNDFKRTALNMFSRIYDTRLLFMLPWSCRDLGERVGPNLVAFYQYLKPVCKEKVQIEFPLGFEHFHEYILRESNRGAHEAAYDAYLTGCLFLFLRVHLGDAAQRYLNHLSVYGSVFACVLDGESDKILHTGDILWFKFPPGRAIGSMALEDGLRSAGIQGRILWSSCTAIAFCATLGIQNGTIQCVQGATGTNVSVVWSPCNAT